MQKFAVRPRKERPDVYFDTVTIYDFSTFLSHDRLPWNSLWRFLITIESKPYYILGVPGNLNDNDLAHKGYYINEY